ncbi:hypothetical protein [Sporichthya sp.]|uniref:hypothetical protein n=1 Tax=Sporichthya sp. TaxID=65475 RepID=UPI001848E70D|nr:hypothetical protein [Sporichthya sp.]MBA3745582.1 hypothetical protein [Sporichthya sp.]
MESMVMFSSEDLAREHMRVRLCEAEHQRLLASARQMRRAARLQRRAVRAQRRAELASARVAGV